MYWLCGLCPPPLDVPPLPKMCVWIRNTCQSSSCFRPIPPKSQTTSIDSCDRSACGRCLCTCMCLLFAMCVNCWLGTAHQIYPTHLLLRANGHIYHHCGLSWFPPLELRHGTCMMMVGAPSGHACSWVRNMWGSAAPKREPRTIMNTVCTQGAELQHDTVCFRSRLD